MNLVSLQTDFGELRTVCASVAHAQNHRKEIKFLAVEQDNHQQWTVTSKSNVEPVTMESYTTSYVNVQT